MMVRKTLEEMCDERQAKGKDLKARLTALKSQVVVPQELLDGADDLRLLGNDAAHSEIRNFAQVGKEEVEVALEFSKELLKAVYQYASLRAKLAALKAKQQPSQP